MNAILTLAVLIPALAAGFGARYLVMRRYGSTPSPSTPTPPKGTAEKRKDSLIETLRKAGTLAQPEIDEESKVRLELLRAGVNLDPLTWRGIQLTALLCAVVLDAVILLFSRLETVYALVCAALCLFIAYGAPKLYLSCRKRKQKSLIGSTLPCALELLNTSMRAGYSIERGIRLVANSTTGPLSQEFRRVDQEINLLGMPLDTSLLRMKARCDTPSVSSFVNAVVQAHHQGTSMGRALNSQAKAARSQHYADLLVKINQLPNKMVPVIFIFFFPIIIVLAVAPVVYNAAVLFMNMT